MLSPEDRPASEVYFPGPSGGNQRGGVFSAPLQQFLTLIKSFFSLFTFSNVCVYTKYTHCITFIIIHGSAFS